MSTASKLLAVLASIILSATLPTVLGISHAAEPVSVPPELAVGELPLVFEEGVDPKNLQALVDETWAKPKALRAEALGMRQMAHTIRCEYDDLKLYPLKS